MKLQPKILPLVLTSGLLLAGCGSESIVVIDDNPTVTGQTGGDNGGDTNGGGDTGGDTSNGDGGDGSDNGDNGDNGASDTSNGDNSTDFYTADYQMTVAFTGPFEERLPAQSVVTVVVFGYDNLVADVSANVLKEITYTGDKPEHYQIAFNTTDFEKIEFQSGMFETLGYYLYLQVDLDGDGEFCDQDLRQNFDVTDVSFLSSADTQVDLEIALTPVKTNCE